MVTAVHAGKGEDIDNTIMSEGHAVGHVGFDTITSIDRVEIIDYLPRCGNATKRDASENDQTVVPKTASVFPTSETHGYLSGTTDPHSLPLVEPVKTSEFAPTDETLAEIARNDTTEYEVDAFIEKLLEENRQSSLVDAVQAAHRAQVERAQVVPEATPEKSAEVAPSNPGLPSLLSTEDPYQQLSIEYGATPLHPQHQNQHWTHYVPGPPSQQKRSASPGRRRDIWDKERLEKLLELGKKVHDDKNTTWDTIAREYSQEFGGRVGQTLARQYKETLRSGVVRPRGEGAVEWTNEESERLWQLRTVDEKTWSEIQDEFPGRTQAACHGVYVRVRQEKEANQIRAQSVRRF